MKKLGFVLMMALLLAGCGRQAQETMEYVQDTAEAGNAYVISIDAPEDAVCEAFGDGDLLYTAADGTYTIIAEELAADSLEEAVRQVSGFSPDALEIVALDGDGVGEYHFAWASCSEEGETVSRCALYAGGGHYYAVTMTQASGLGGTYDAVAEAVFSSVRLESEQII